MGRDESLVEWIEREEATETSSRGVEDLKHPVGNKLERRPGQAQW